MDTDTFQKMVSGAWYEPWKLNEVRRQAQMLCARYNALRVEDATGREACLKELLGAIGEGTVIEQPFHCDYGKNIRLGARCFLNYQCILLDCAPITFGEHVLCGPNCGLYTAVHPVDPAQRLTDMERALPITLEDNVWLGGSVTVLPGVTIGRNTVVGAGSVVTKSLPSNVVVAGNPARIIREL